MSYIEIYPTQRAEERMARRVLAAVEDLLFKSKILETAKELDVEVHFPRSPKKLLAEFRESPPELLILDLNSARFGPLEILQEIKSGVYASGVTVVGFLSHVQKDLAVAAKEAGCDRIVARSAFTRDLPKIIAGESPENTVDEAGVG